MRSFMLLAGLAALSVLTACGGDEPAAEATPSPVVTETAGETSLPSPPEILPSHDQARYAERVAVFEERAVAPGGTAILGDSLTEWTDWQALLPEADPVNFGIAGDVAQGVERRLYQVEAAAPEKVVLLIGTNDLALGLTPEEIGDEVAVILDRLQQGISARRIYVQSVLPREARFEQRIRDLNNRLMREAYMRGMWFVFLHDAFLDEAGQAMNPALTSDGLHLNEDGYRLWAETLRPYLAEFPTVPGTAIEIPDYYPPGGKTQYVRRASMFEEREVAPGGIAFVGDSITEGGDWAALFPSLQTVNFGIGWDQTGGLLNRIGQIERAEPDRIVLMIGTNDIGNGQSVEDAAANTREALRRFKEFVPAEDILLQSLPPRGAEFNDEVMELNAMLERIAAEEGVAWLDIYSPFVVEDHLDPSVTNDALHFTADGYQRWRGLLAPWLGVELNIEE